MPQLAENCGEPILCIVPAGTVGKHVPHKLRLQLLSAAFSADVKCAFLDREPLVPGRKMHHGSLVFPKRTPHDPPAITGTFHDTAIRARTSVIRTRDLQKIF